jgi:hypothetical protein
MLEVQNPNSSPISVMAVASLLVKSNDSEGMLLDGDDEAPSPQVNSSKSWEEDDKCPVFTWVREPYESEDVIMQLEEDEGLLPPIREDDLRHRLSASPSPPDELMEQEDANPEEDSSAPIHDEGIMFFNQPRQDTSSPSTSSPQQQQQQQGAEESPSTSQSTPPGTSSQPQLELPVAAGMDDVFKETFKKLTESMKRSQETRQSLRMTTAKTDKYPRRASVSKVLSSIESSSRQIDSYLQTLQTLTL